MSKARANKARTQSTTESAQKNKPVSDPLPMNGGGCTQAGIKVCVSIGGGGFVEQYVPNPTTPGRKQLQIEDGIIFWGTTAMEEMFAQFVKEQQAVMRTKEKPRRKK